MIRRLLESIANNEPLDNKIAVKYFERDEADTLFAVYELEPLTDAEWDWVVNKWENNEYIDEVCSEEFRILLHTVKRRREKKNEQVSN